MSAYKNQFGLAGQSDTDYDFFIGRKKRKKAKARKAARKLLSSKQVAATPRVIQPAPQRVTPTVAPSAPARPASVTVAQPTEQTMPVSNADVSIPPMEGETVASPAQEEMAEEGGSENSFLGFGKKARQRRQLKRAEKAAGVERMKAETATIKSIAAPPQSNRPMQSSAPIQGSASAGSVANAPVTDAGFPQENSPEKKSNMTMILAIAGGVLVLGVGLMLMLKKPAPVGPVSAV